MKRTLSVLFTLIFVAAVSFGQDNKSQEKKEEKERKLIQSLNLDSLDLLIEPNQNSFQEEVKVEAPDYPGLNLSFDNPAIALQNYKPYTRQELRAYSDLLVDYSLANDGGGSVTARPNKPGRLLRVTVPD